MRQQQAELSEGLRQIVEEIVDNLPVFQESIADIIGTQDKTSNVSNTVPPENDFVCLFTNSSISDEMKETVRISSQPHQPGILKSSMVKLKSNLKMEKVDLSVEESDKTERVSSKCT